MRTGWRRSDRWREWRNSRALDLAQRQHEAGNITDLALGQQQAVDNSARLELAMVENDQREHREKLNRLLSLWGGDTAWRIAEALPPLRRAKWPCAALNRSRWRSASTSMWGAWNSRASSAPWASRRRIATSARRDALSGVIRC